MEVRADRINIQQSAINNAEAVMLEGALPDLTATI